MDDTAKALVLGFLGLIVVHAGLERRARHDAARQLDGAFHHSGALRLSVEPRGMLGALGNRLYAIDVTGTGQSIDKMPFASIPRSGWKGEIRHLRVHLDSLTLKGLPVERLDADIPNVTYDIGQALYKDRLVIRGAGEGPATVRIGADGLRRFIDRKYGQTVTDVAVAFRGGRVQITGDLMFLGAKAPFVALGDMTTRSGRYVDLAQADVTLNGKPLSPDLVQAIIRQLNPLLDIADDLGLAGYLKLTSVSVGADAVTVYATATIPVLSTPSLGPGSGH
ncbi:MAG TPA: DUF2993 domain-containing protein [Chthonomonadaceae bacterium]|nr:DUF2993 domain-containing protein [Chthonomonadaceae bacterium]